jgi:glutaminyl-tRNA synthetase
VKENIKIFEEMKQGVHKEGEHVLRAKIDMSSSNLLMRDPIMYRVIFKNHHRLKKKWCLFPTYDWTHGQSDYIERISHSLCSLEFKPHRDLYEWFLNKIGNQSIKYPKQREFARLNLSYTIMSKRKLAELVDNGYVKGWDDPRMPTISGLRRRGYTPEALKKFIKTAGISKRENLIDVSLLEYCIRENLNKVANRVMVVLDPVKLIITNYPEDKNEKVQIVNNPEDLNSGTRNVSFSREIYIEREDFKEIANRKYFRLSIGKEVRLKSAYIIKAISCNKDNNGKVMEILCEYDPKSKSGSGTIESERKVKGTIHWVSKSNSLDAVVNLYDRLFKNEFPEKTKGKSFAESFNENSLKRINVKAERSVENSKAGQIFQFQRKGYFVVDDDSKKGNLIFNRTVELRDNWTKKN